MAEEKPKGEGAAAEKGASAGDKKPAKKPINKKIFIIAGILVADLGIMAGLGFFIVGKLKGKQAPDPAIQAQKEQEEAEKEKKHELTKIGMVLPKPLPFTVNIPGTPPHYLKCAIQLEWDGVEAAGGGGHGGGAPGTDATGHEIEKRMPKITDIIINILSSQTFDDLLKASGKQKMKEAIVTEINAILPEPHHDPEHEEKHEEGAPPPPSGKLRNAFFTEFIVQ
ncbi:MAG: flagellar basal body-associated FliL family protein [Fibrobacteria bacterium]